jgi:hypothetical protein
MLVAAAAGLCQVPGPWSNDDDSPIAACQDDALQVGHRRGQRDLMDDHYLADHVVDSVLLLADGGKLTVSIGAAENRIV